MVVLGGYTYLTGKIACAVHCPLASMDSNNKQHKTMVSIGLVRVSSKIQEDGLSVASQSERLTNAGCDLLLEYTESGFKKNRRTFDHLRQLVEAGGVESVKAIRVDRAGRLVTQLLEIVDFLQEHNVRIEFLDLPVDVQTASGRLMLTQMAAYAEYFSRELSEKQRNVNAYKRRHGIIRHGVFPYRYENRKLVPDDEPYGETGLTRWQIGRSVIDAALTIGTARGTVRWICQTYGKERIYPLRKEPPRSTIGLIDWINNPALRGYFYDWQTERILPADHPPLLTEHEYESIKRLFVLSASRKGYGAKSKIHPLSGLVYCVCGSNCSVGISNTRQAGIKNTYYACDAHRKTHCPDQPEGQRRRKSIRADVVEMALIEALVARGETLAQIVHTPDIPINPRVIEIDREIEQFRALSGGSMADLAKEAIHRLTLERTALSQPSPHNTEAEQYLIKMSSKAMYLLLTAIEKRSVYHWLTERIIIRENQILEINLRF